ncbi:MULTISPECIES: TrmH family RNA methyltransferase [Nitrospirillum]|uniref:TrmH RNA methyltransferase n=1 Tax=Nitrospirillum amazonense TaxID=28077 RepID=A0A560ETR9_9PROT|nr:RNA methyltransferase [Nitrospirillum amazonense]MEC4594996.1 RNA methyltransferase [Nitrospirillum amazonense]TWB12781.1 TrmH RNA methyltransferase [Nitrospirillum amazonense]
MPDPRSAKGPSKAAPQPASKPAAESVIGENTRRKAFRVLGLPAVAALFARDPDRVERLFFDDRMKEKVGAYCAGLAQARKVYRLLPAEEMEKVAGTPLHGGVVAVAAPRPVLPLDIDEAARWAAAGEPLMILDGVGNPHNLGAIVRTCAFFGINRLVLSDHAEQALPSEAAYRVAEGGFEYVTLYQLPRFAQSLRHLRAHYRIVGTALGDHPDPAAALSMPNAKPAALILGNEEVGLPATTLQACNQLVTLRGSGQVQSLNVSATAAILVHALATPGPAASGARRG